MHTFENKAVLVVGGSSGIGYATAILMAERGAQVYILADRGVEKAKVEAQKKGLTIHGVCGDATDSNLLQSFVQDIVKQSGGVHVAVHTAAIHPYGNVVETPESIWDQVMAVNLKSVYLTAKYVLPFMEKQKEGVIVNVSSVQATACQNDVAAYATSKAAILGLTRSLAVDYTAKGIRAIAISPGSIRTPMLDLSVEKFGEGCAKEDVFKKWGEGLPAKRIGEPNEVAQVIAFAASSQASYCSGSEWVVDGGLSIQL